MISSLPHYYLTWNTLTSLSHFDLMTLNVTFIISKLLEMTCYASNLLVVQLQPCLYSDSSTQIIIYFVLF